MATSSVKNKSAVKAPKIESSLSVPNDARLEVLKTYKLYIGGQFPRTESGRYYTVINAQGELLANMCLSSRKDFRDAVGAARSAYKGWSAKTAMNRSQILYRIAEMLEGRREQFIAELIKQGAPQKQAAKEVDASVDRLIYYSGWCDKYQQVFSAVNPVASSHFNFSTPEPTGVVAAVAPQSNSLIGLVSVIAAAIAGGNAVIVLASEQLPLCAITLAEVIHSSDVPGGVVNILTGSYKELAGQMALHMDVNAVIFCEDDKAAAKDIQEKAAMNVKRVHLYTNINWMSDDAESPYFIADLQETKTTWHPIENIGGGGSKY